MKQTMAAKSRSKTISLLALFIGILCLYFPVTTTAVVAESGAAVDLLYLTLVWPGTLCRTGKCCMPTKGKPAIDFLIEDLKTMDQYGQIIQNSKPKCSFSINQMSSLIPDLYSNWCNLSCPCNDGFTNWKKTWCNYGRCSELNQTSYIMTALNLTASANLLEVFQVNGIVPSSSDSYKLGDIYIALMANLGLSTQVECVTITKGASNSTLLSKINFCVSADGQNFINCPFDIKQTCDRELWFYPFTRKQLKKCRKDYVSSGGLIKMATEKHLAM
ncbi:ribonuclease 3-like isoform X3 [Dioscorea cayenensis subsp. rotundata]|uniref:Ribonuclease 3-like isoform X3 n=1 Tax=Dioscorea cayennensis subsp. rotundata TaxID=55577 RepID=A0AB40BBU3_DIOCR|nr:ribonuclease 3-like isoform X3 [Dioscorea cayenensis subsp. rotundata]